MLYLIQTSGGILAARAISPASSEQRLSRARETMYLGSVQRLASRF
jgi:hypothetical protein